MSTDRPKFAMSQQAFARQAGAAPDGFNVEVIQNTSLRRSAVRSSAWLGLIDSEIARNLYDSVLFPVRHM
jgi:hypothetical protein